MDIQYREIKNRAYKYMKCLIFQGFMAYGLLFRQIAVVITP